MKTRYSSLVSVKKNIMQKSERVLQAANAALHNATQALKTSYEELELIHAPLSGKITELLSTRTLLDSQRALIKHNEEWVQFAKNELAEAKKQLKIDMIEFEKYQYLEFQEIQAALKKIKIQEAKDLDEVALITHARKDKTKVA
jgi:hypothetical protein